MSRPVSMGARLSAFVLVVLGVLAGQLGAAPAASARLWEPSVDAALDPLVDLVEYEDRVLVAVNRKRARAGLPKVAVFDSCADLLAETWAARLALLGELVHRDQQVVLARCGYRWAGEVLVAGTATTPRAAVRAWMASPPHRAVLMARGADRAGIGTARALDGRLYSVLDFGDAP